MNEVSSKESACITKAIIIEILLAPWRDLSHKRCHPPLHGFHNSLFCIHPGLLYILILEQLSQLRNRPKKSMYARKHHFWKDLYHKNYLYFEVYLCRAVVTITIMIVMESRGVVWISSFSCETFKYSRCLIEHSC
jgi:hypothetical protein